MIAILMSTYNGGQYLKEQLDSILSQSYFDFVLYIRDDGSTDETVSIIRSYSDSRIQLIEGENVGPANSFFSLLNIVQDADYVFFSDQDDIWLPNKIEKLLSEIRRYDEIPTMVFSDFAAIDTCGNILNQSYAESASLQVKSGINSVSKVIAQPYVFGCASVINKRLVQIVKNPPKGIEMHDCWICQCAASVGNLVYIPEQTILHRFHANNATGKFGQNSFISRLKRGSIEFQNQVKNTELTIHQVQLLLTYQSSHLLPEVREILQDLSRSFKKGKISTIRSLYRNGVTRQKWWNTAFFYFSVLWTKGDFT